MRGDLFLDGGNFLFRATSIKAAARAGSLFKGAACLSLSSRDIPLPPIQLP